MTRLILRRGAGVSLVFGWVLLATAAAQNQRPSSSPASAPYGGATVSDWTGKVQVQPPGGSLVVCC